MSILKVLYDFIR